MGAGTGSNSVWPNNPAPQTVFHDLGRAADRAAESMQRLFESSYESKVDRMVEEARKAGVPEDEVNRIVSETTRDAVLDDIDEDEIVRRMAKVFQRARDQARHGVTYVQDGDVAEMDVMIFTERVDPAGVRSWGAAVQSLVTRLGDHRALRERLDTAERGGRIVVEVEAVRGGKGTVERRNHLDEVAVSLLTGLPVRFRVTELKRENILGYGGPVSNGTNFLLRRS